MKWKNCKFTTDTHYCLHENKCEGTMPNDVVLCECGCNPNIYQNEEQMRFEIDYIKEHGKCSACISEEEGTILDGEVE